MVHCGLGFTLIERLEMENKLTPEDMLTALLNPKIMVAAMLKVMAEKHGKLIDFQKVGCYSYELYRMPDNEYVVVKEPQMGGNIDEFKIEMCETEKEAEALFDQWADAEMGVKK